MNKVRGANAVETAPCKDPANKSMTKHLTDRPKVLRPSFGSCDKSKK